jgi:hypothetical protein
MDVMVRLVKTQLQIQVQAAVQHLLAVQDWW